MTNDTIYGVTDTHLNSRAKYCELRFITTWKSRRPKTMYKYIDSGKPYHYTYYFSTEDKAREFENYLFNKYEKEKQENQEYANKIIEEYNKVYNTKLFEYLMNLYEFSFYKTENEDGETVLKVTDKQGANLGDIESEEFKDFAEILNRMEVYHNDYIVECLANAIDDELQDITDEWATWEELYNICIKYIDRLPDYKFEIECLYLILHADILKGINERL